MSNPHCRPCTLGDLPAGRPHRQMARRRTRSKSLLRLMACICPCRPLRADGPRRPDDRPCGPPHVARAAARFGAPPRVRGRWGDFEKDTILIHNGNDSDEKLKQYRDCVALLRVQSHGVVVNYAYNNAIASASLCDGGVTNNRRNTL